jgi:hypothetical protein
MGAPKVIGYFLFVGAQGDHVVSIHRVAVMVDGKTPSTLLTDVLAPTAAV